MTEKKRKTKAQILGELESIKTLLQEDEDGLQDDASEADPPLLTEALDSVIRDIEAAAEIPEPDPASVPDNEDEAIPNQDIPNQDSPSLDNALDEDDIDIPVLQPEPESVPDADSANSLEQTIDDAAEDIVARALRQKASPEPDREPEHPPEQHPSEQQPGLFDEPAASTTAPKAIPSKTEKMAPATKSPPTTNPAVSITHPADATAENPFLPKHIRDRLHTGRTLQQEIDNTSRQNRQATRTRSPETASPATEVIDETTVEQLLQSIMPRVEEELREKIRAILREELKEELKE